VRIPAVILERKRAGELYNELKQQSIDPGLLQMGERGAEEPNAARFSARVLFRFQAGARSAWNLNITKSIPVESLKSYFAIPLRPDAYQAQVAHHLKIILNGSRPRIDQFPVAGESLPAAARSKIVRIW